MKLLSLWRYNGNLFLIDLTSHLNELNVKLKGSCMVASRHLTEVTTLGTPVYFPNLTSVVQCVETLDLEEYIKNNAIVA